jgi:exopolysaccharide production protein ExoQ
MSQSIHPRISEINRVRSYRPGHSRGTHSVLNGPNPTALFDKFAILPILACCFAVIVFPLLGFFTPISAGAGMNEAVARPETRIFWPIVAAISALLALQNRSRLTGPPHIICLVAYLAFAGVSAFWAFSPGHSFIRYIQQVMIITSIVPPIMLASRTVDLLRCIFLCFSIALILNLFFVFGGSSQTAMYSSKLVKIGYAGYFAQKNDLGECAAAAYLLALHELFQKGWGRRFLGAIVVVIAVCLVFLSQSKTAFGLALVCPLLAWLTLIVRKLARVSLAVILLILPVCYALLSSVAHSSLMERLSYILYRDSTLTGRTIIWDFAKSEIARRPFVGWGYQSFWLVPDSPGFWAPGFIKMMPNAHNGYYDTMLETGYVGLVLLLVFIVSTLHAVGRVADRDPARAQFMLSYALFFILYNFFESLWMRGYLFLWVMFVIVAAEIGRYWRPPGLRRALAERAKDGGKPSPVTRHTNAAAAD